MGRHAASDAAVNRYVARKLHGLCDKVRDFPKLQPPANHFVVSRLLSGGQNHEHTRVVQWREWERAANNSTLSHGSVLIFEPADRPLSRTRNFEKLDNGYSVGEYDWALIEQYLKDKDSAPE